MRRTKKPIIAMLVLSMLALAACEKSEFGVTENTGRLITIEAQNADEGDFFLTGSLEVGDGEQIAVKADLSKGAVKVEIVQTPENQSIDKLPDLDDEPIITANVSGTDAASGTVPAGWYMVKATCLEKASGTVRVEVEPADG